jgi:hypothetical protein
MVVVSGALGGRKWKEGDVIHLGRKGTLFTLLTNYGI